MYINLHLCTLPAVWENYTYFIILYSRQKTWSFGRIINHSTCFVLNCLLPWLYHLQRIGNSCRLPSGPIGGFEHLNPKHVDSKSRLKNCSETYFKVSAHSLVLNCHNLKHIYFIKNKNFGFNVRPQKPLCTLKLCIYQDLEGDADMRSPVLSRRNQKGMKIHLNEKNTHLSYSYHTHIFIWKQNL